MKRWSPVLSYGEDEFVCRLVKQLVAPPLAVRPHYRYLLRPPRLHPGGSAAPHSSPASRPALTVPPASPPAGAPPRSRANRPFIQKRGSKCFIPGKMSLGSQKNIQYQKEGGVYMKKKPCTRPRRRLRTSESLVRTRVASNIKLLEI